MGKRLMIYDTTTFEDGVALEDWRQDGLTYSWLAGGRLYRWLRWLDKSKGVKSWDEALDFIIEQGQKEKVSQVQYWGHGYWGRGYVGTEVMDLRSLQEGRHLSDKLKAVGEVMDDDGVWWWRTCQTYGTEAGHKFAKRFTELLGCKTAAHTHTIGVWQSGGYSLMPGEEPSWSVDEGVKSRPEGKHPIAKWSGFREPNTVLCLQGHLPKEW